LVIKRIDDWAKQKWGVTVSAIGIAKEMTKEEIPKELINTLTAIELRKEIKHIV
jgi:hypothetical protein